MTQYVELHARSALSFLRGASQPDELSSQANVIGMPAMALCDRDGIYGTARMHHATYETGVRGIVGAELTMEDGCVLPVLVKTHEGYRNLSRLITAAKFRGSKTQCSVKWDELPAYATGLIVLTGDIEGILDHRAPQASAGRLQRLMRTFGDENVVVEIQRHFLRGEERRNQFIEDIAAAHQRLIVATNAPLFHKSERREAQDVFTCMRHHTTLSQAGQLLAANHHRYLKGTKEMMEVFADHPEYVSNTEHIAKRCEFTLRNLGYNFPRYEETDGLSMDDFLRRQTLEGARRHYGGKIPAKVRRQIDVELALIAKLRFAGYFLIVWDLIQYCKSHSILAQGRGSAANSTVCFCLGITVCDPMKYRLLFERFLTEGRTQQGEHISWPDIDIDLPSGDRREQVIQEVYRRYGRHGAAMTANVITYRGRSTMREIGKALEFSEDNLKRFSSLFANGDFPQTLDLETQLAQSGITKENPRLAAAARLYQNIQGLPRHLGQHSGGMIIYQGELDAIVPLENASMPGRVVAQWDKNDCEDLGIVKVDLLGLGMMAAIQDTLEICSKRGKPVTLTGIDKEDPKVFDLMQRADTIGTFQVESRAQMATLPRLKPKEFYDVAIQVAIVRPGPIQGDMVNPYLQRRQGLQEISYFGMDELLEPVLKRTLGVPLFQEQLLEMSMKVAGFTGSQAEALRRALSFHRSHKRMNKACADLERAMEKRNVPSETRKQILKSVESFAVYGFPESHAIGFGTIAYVSCWLKVYYPAEFYYGLLNNMPMGFYSANTLIEDAKKRGVKFRPVSVLESDWLCTIDSESALRLGLCMVRGLNSRMGTCIAEENARRRFDSLVDFRERINPDKPLLRQLARIGALNGLVEHRRDGLWQVEIPSMAGELSFSASTPSTPLPQMTPMERLQADFAGTSVTTGAHPMRMLRERVPDAIPAAELPNMPNGSWVEIAGMVICRQRPGTAKGVVFVSLEDETGIANAILWSDFFEKHRLLITQESFLRITGRLQIASGVIHIQARGVYRIENDTLQGTASHDFH